MDSYQRLVNYLKEIVVDIVPMNSDREEEYRFHTRARNVDNKRPINSDEEKFFRDLRIKELDIMRGMIKLLISPSQFSLSLYLIFSRCRL